MHRILDTNYEKSDLNKVMGKKCQHLSTEEHYRLMNLLNRFKYIFDCTLGTWNTTPVDLELKNNAKPFCSLPCPVPRVHELMLKKRSKDLLSWGWSNMQTATNGEHYHFDQPKEKTNCVRLLSDIWTWIGK